MKISQMLKREDFYKINEETLNNYFNGQGKKVKLFIYPKLNAIITSNPSKSVKKYLYNEYQVKGNWIKKIIIKFYIAICLLSKGLLASKSIKINANITNDTLIYPCNKKYRIFDFKNGIVDVIAKNGFPTRDLEREILFRTKYKENFIPELFYSNDRGYSEKIIDGMPLARVTEGFEKYQKLAIETLEKYSDMQGQTKFVSAKVYADELLDKIKDFSDKITKNINKELLIEIAQGLLNKVTDKAIKLVLSHGDLQPGNIWIEKSGRMYIIDWESWDVRSEWYDKTALYGNLRSGDFKEIFKKTDNDEVFVVFLEDLIFKLNELNNLPFDYGEKDFDNYTASLKIIVNGDD